jgi:hypothetical protein
MLRKQNLVDVKLIKTLNIAGEIIAKKEEIKKKWFMLLYCRRGCI